MDTQIKYFSSISFNIIAVTKLYQLQKLEIDEYYGISILYNIITLYAQKYFHNI